VPYPWDAPAAVHGDARALLPPVLERVKTVVYRPGRILRLPVHPDDAALLVQRVVLETARGPAIRAIEMVHRR